ncbi:MAG: hypothetical protein ABWX90_03105 [Candidatus Saccharimonadales bacterium]
MTLLFALLSLAIGATLVLLGYRFARILLPLLGFLSGLSIGGAVISDIGGTVFLGTALGIIVGIISGLILAALAYFYYYMAVTIAAASLGYWAGSGLILLLGFSPGILSVLAGIAVGTLVGVLSVMSNVPKYVLITLTSFAGAILTVGGVMLLFGQIPLEAYSYTAANIAVSNSFIWTVVTFGLFGIGVISQIVTTNNYELSEWNVGQHNTTPPTALPQG